MHNVFRAATWEVSSIPVGLSQGRGFREVAGMTASASDLDVPELLRGIDSALNALQTQCALIAQTVQGVHRRLAVVEAALAASGGEGPPPTDTPAPMAAHLPPIRSLTAAQDDGWSEAEHRQGKRRIREWEHLHESCRHGERRDAEGCRNGVRMSHTRSQYSDGDL